MEGSTSGTSRRTKTIAFDRCSPSYRVIGGSFSATTWCSRMTPASLSCLVLSFECQGAEGRGDAFGARSSARRMPSRQRTFARSSNGHMYPESCPSRLTGPDSRWRSRVRSNQPFQQSAAPGSNCILPPLARGEYHRLSRGSPLAYRLVVRLLLNSGTFGRPIHA